MVRGFRMVAEHLVIRAQETLMLSSKRFDKENLTLNNNV